MSRRKLIITCLLIWLVAVGVRILSWQDNRLDAAKVEWVIASEYREAGEKLARGEVSAVLRNLYYMTHPPGYSLVLALIFKTIGTSQAGVRMVQIVCDGLACVIVLLIAVELLPLFTATIAGLLVALSPQLAYYPSLALPDSLTVLPLLLAVYFLTIACKRPRLWLLAATGVMVGISCLLRANALLLTPFLAVSIALFFRRGVRLRFASALIIGTAVIILPVTIKNLVVWHSFVPLSLGAGQKLLEGVAEYDREGRFGIPKTDLGIVLQEAQVYNRSDYAKGLFSGDGIQRDRARLSRGLSVVSRHPFWYATVMVRRGVSFLRLARVPLVAGQPTFSHALSLSATDQKGQLLSPSLLSGYAQAALTNQSGIRDDGQILLIGDDTTDGPLFTSTEIAVKKNCDYLLVVPITLKAGRVQASVLSLKQDEPLANAIIDPVEAVPPDAQPSQNLILPFATGSAETVHLVFKNAGSKPQLLLGATRMLEGGPTLYGWTRLPRLVLNFSQRAFVTAIILPLALLGIGLLIRERSWQSLLLLLIVPAYYLIVQSALHTERRYVIAIHYFMLVLVAVTIAFVVRQLTRWKKRVRT